MRSIAVLGVSLLCLMAGAAYAQEGDDDTAPQDPCHQQVTNTENAVGDKTETDQLSEAVTDQIDELLDEADDDCTAGDTKSAAAKLQQVMKLAK
jgi:hypothetical protein